MILALLGAVLAAPVDPDRLAQEARVEAAAAAVAEARADGRRRTEIAALMAQFRAEAEALAAMAAPADDSGARAAALARLVSATADGKADPADRALVAGWLGALDARLTTLTTAIETPVRDPALRRTIALDVQSQCQAVMVAAAYDAAVAEAAARTARLQAAALSSGDPRPTSGEAGERARRLLAEADTDDTFRAVAWALHERAAALRERARVAAGETP